MTASRTRRKELASVPPTPGRDIWRTAVCSSRTDLFGGCRLDSNPLPTGLEGFWRESPTAEVMSPRWQGESVLSAGARQAASHSAPHAGSTSAGSTGSRPAKNGKRSMNLRQRRPALSPTRPPAARRPRGRRPFRPERPRWRRVRLRHAHCRRHRDRHRLLRLWYRQERWVRYR